jgi:hypothetical protein
LAFLAIDQVSNVPVKMLGPDRIKKSSFRSSYGADNQKIPLTIKAKPAAVIAATPRAIHFAFDDLRR